MFEVYDQGLGTLVPFCQFVRLRRGKHSLFVVGREARKARAAGERDSSSGTDT